MSRLVMARMASVRGHAELEHRGVMSKRTRATCSDCYFRNAGLCALPGEATCPTFRLATRGSLNPPRQPRLVPRPEPALAPGHIAAYA
jgi:hypothetical protein